MKLDSRFTAARVETPSHGDRSSGRVVVTGLGVVSALGIGRQEFWPRILAGESGISPVSGFDTSAFRVHLGGEIRGFDPAPFVERSQGAGRATKLAIAAARLAVADAGLEMATLPPERMGGAVGTTSGEPLEIERLNDEAVRGAASASERFLRAYPCHALATCVADELGAAGPTTVLPTACAAGNYAAAFGAQTLAAGRADFMVVGGADAFSRITFTGFARLGAITPDVCRPFDRNRKGMVPAEGAAMLVLEPLAQAQRRGARIWGEIRGYGLSCDAHHMTAAHPEGAGAARAMTEALRSARIAPEDVDYISAHGTGTPTNDRLESLAVRAAFGAAADRVPISSIKSMLGHAMGAASAIEAVVCCLALDAGVVPPTINYETPDPQCDLDVVPNEARELPVRVVMSNAYAFGGNNASVIFARVS
jgi:3-oxoacyl-[acyl-carrier-protein] synthase II